MPGTRRLRLLSRRRWATLAVRRCREGRVRGRGLGGRRACTPPPARTPGTGSTPRTRVLCIAVVATVSAAAAVAAAVGALTTITLTITPLNIINNHTAPLAPAAAPAAACPLQRVESNPLATRPARPPIAGRYWRQRQGIMSTVVS